MEYKKVINAEVQFSVLDQVLESKIFDEEEKQKRIAMYLNSVRNQIDDIVQTTEFKDMRLFRGLLEAFTDTAVLFEKETLTADFLNSLFNSMLITHLCYYHNSVGDLDLFVNGANLEFLFRLFYSSEDMPALIRVRGNADELRWLDVGVSGYWILNLSVPDDTAAVYEDWKQYPYAVLEWKMVRDADLWMEEENFGLLHILYYQKEVKTDTMSNAQWELRVKRALQDYDLGRIEEVQAVLDMVDRVSFKVIYRIFQNALFHILSQGQADGRVVGEGYIYSEYNEFLDKR